LPPPIVGFTTESAFSREFVHELFLNNLRTNEQRERRSHIHTLFAEISHFSVGMSVCTAGHVTAIDAKLLSTPISTCPVVF
jgi:hypothetical protein